MPRVARIAPGGLIYHVLNRGVGRTALFRSARDYETFVRCLRTAQESESMRILAYCVMPNHWHLVLWPRRDGDLARFMLRLTITHVRRWLIHRHQVGTGHVYQGRYKSFAVQDDGHLATVCRYVERHPMRAGLAKRSADWAHGSAGQEALPAELRVALCDWPIARRRDWRTWVDRPQRPAEEMALRRCVSQGRPYGDERWVEKMRKRLGWREPLKIGRPRKRKP
jgi:putative transposase